MQLTKGKSENCSYGLTSKGYFTPYYVNGKFVMNLVASSQKSKDGNRKDLARILFQLRKNKGKFFKLHGRFDNPFEMLEWMLDNGYHLEPHHFGEDNTPFRKSSDYVDFHGNLKEYSAAFDYRIYDSEMIERLKKEVLR